MSRSILALHRFLSFLTFFLVNVVVVVNAATARDDVANSAAVAAARMLRKTNDQRSLAVDRNTRKLTALVLLLEWNNHSDRSTVIPREQYDTLFNDVDATDSYSYPVGGVRKFFKTMSYDKLDMDFIVAEWFPSEFTQQDFTSDGSKGRGQNFQQAFTPALEYLESTGFDFGRVDTNGDKKIDLTVVLHSGFDGIISIDDCLNGEPADQRVSSHAWSGASNNPDYSFVSSEGYRVGPYAVASAFDGPHTNPKQWPNPTGDCRMPMLARPGTILHEMIHTFGLPEMYDVEYVGKLPNGQGGIDRFGVMGNASGNTGGNLGYPGHMSAWSRLQFGWANPKEITEDGTYTIRPVERFEDIYVIKKGFANDKEYLLLENRQAISGDFDEMFFNPGGVLIYHVDENIWDEYKYSSGPKGQYPRGGPFLGDSWPSNGKHYPVAMLQADGLYELEQGINGGMDQQGVRTSNDIWNQPNQKISPEGTHDGKKYPNTDSYAFGEIKPTGITIQNFRLQPDGETMTFDISGLDAMKVEDGGDEQPAPEVVEDGGDEQPAPEVVEDGGDEQQTPVLPGIDYNDPNTQPTPETEKNEEGTITETDTNEEGTADSSSSIGRGSLLGSTYILPLIALLVFTTA